jgi:hypothetical protein
MRPVQVHLEVPNAVSGRFTLENALSVWRRTEIFLDDAEEFPTPSWRGRSNTSSSTERA